MDPAKRPSPPVRALALALVAALAAALGLPGRAHAGPVTALVPAYFYPSFLGSPWDELNRAAARIPIEAIMNPASGPGTAPNSDYVRAVAALQAAGGKVLGYVPTGFGTRLLAEVLQDIDRYLDWYRVDGIFLDEMAVRPGGLDYSAVYQYIKRIDPSLHVVGNPGIPFLRLEDYLPAADTLVIFEGPLTNPDPFGASFEKYPTEGPYAGLPLPFLDLPRERFSNIVFGVPTADAMRAALAKALRLNAGYVYFTDDVLPNPYDTLPSYWAEEVAAIEAINAQAVVPEPATLVAGAIAALWGLAYARRRRAAT